MIGLAAALALGCRIPDPPGPAPTWLPVITAPVLRAGARECPHRLRAMLRSQLAFAVTDSSAAGRHIGLARRIADALDEAWGDPSSGSEVARFVRWGPAERLVKVRSDSLRRAGNELMLAGGPPEALPVWHRALRDAVSIGDSAGIAATSGNLGRGYYEAGLADSAARYFGRASEVARRIGDRVTVANAQDGLGALAKERGDLAAARAAFLRAYRAHRSAGDARGAGADRLNLGLLAEARGELGKARAGYLAALELSKQAGSIDGMATALQNLGALAGRMADRTEARHHFEAALELVADSGYRPARAEILQAWAIVELDGGEYLPAIRLLDQARALYRELGDQRGLARATHDLGMANLATGNLGAASALLDLADSNARAGPWLLERAVIARARGDLDVELNDLGQAGDQYALAESLFRASGHTRGAGAAREGLARILLARGDDRAALRVLDSSNVPPDAGERDRAARLVLIGVANGRLGQGVEARRALTLAGRLFRRLRDRVGEAIVAVTLGELALGAGRLTEAETLVRAGRSRLGGRVAPAVRAELALLRARVFRRQGRLAPAAAEYRLAALETEGIAAAIPWQERRTDYRADKWGAYRELVMVEHARGNASGAFAASERLRARELSERLARRREPPAKPDDSPPVMTELRRTIVSLSREIERSAARRLDQRGVVAAPHSDAELEALLSRAESRYAALLRARPELARPITPPPLDPAAVMKALPADAALIEFFLADETALAFVVTNGGIRAVDLATNRRATAAGVDFIRATIAARGQGWRRASRRLGRQLFGPIEATGLLQGKRLLLVVPHAELHRLPFAVLGQSSSPERYLVERYDLEVIPSAAIWLRHSGSLTASDRVLAMAPLPNQLPGARDEARAIGRYFGANATVVIGNAATKDVLRSGGSYGIVHLATFAVLNPRNPIFSHLALAPDRERDDRLDVHEIPELPLRARLVVLGACQTAMGAGARADVPPGDDWIGLGQAFLAGGADRVVATLWPVDDRPSAAFVAEFYRALAGGQPDVRALSLAQRQAIRTPAMAHPALWAAFVLLGRA